MKNQAAANSVGRRSYAACTRGIAERAGALAQALEVPPSSMSFHLAQLANAGLVTQQRHSRSIVYSADYAVMNGLMAYLTENCCAGNACVAAPSCTPAISEEKDVA